MSKIKAWIQAVRVFSFTASMTPVLIAAALALCGNKSVSWPLLPLIAICSLLLHAGTNVISEYFDLEKGVDKSYTFGSSRVLVDGLLKPKEALTGGYILFAAAFLIGLILVAQRGWPVLVFGVIGMIGGIFYSARPVGYKYIGLGDMAVFLLMGPLMVVGAYFVLTGGIDKKTFYVSLPVGFLVTAILNANNLRDIKYDKQARVSTLETLIGCKGAMYEYFFLIAAAYLATAAMCVTKVLPLWSCVVFLTAPMAFKNMKLASLALEQEPARVAVLDQKTAGLHLLFGMLLFLSLVAGKFIR